MRFILAAFLFCLSITGAAADTIGSHTRTTAMTLESEKLGETREIFVRTPLHYDENRAYPVVYVLDGEWNFELVAAQLDYLTDNNMAPPVIVTGVRNVNRNRDYLSVEEPGFRDTGKGSVFLEFVAEEWTSAIDNAYVTAPERVLIGHSFGGVAAINAFLTRPELFHAYIAISASAWVGDHDLYEKAKVRFSEGVPEGRFIYMAPGEFDGGPTRPSGEKLATAFEELAPETLDWTFELIPDADHFRAFTGGLTNGLNKLFPVAGLDKAVVAAAETNGRQGVEDWFAAQEASLGYRFYPSWFDFGVAAMRLSRGDNSDAGVAVIEQGMPYHTENAHFHSFASAVYENTGDIERAIEANDKAIELTQKYGLHPNALHLDRLEDATDRLREKLATQEDN